MSDTSTSVNEFLSGFLEVLRKSSKLLYFSFDEGVAQLLYGVVDDALIGLSRFKDLLAKRIEGGLGAIARSCAKFDCEHRVSLTHGKVGVRADVVEYEVYVFGLASVVVRVVDGRSDAQSSVGPILDKRWSGVCVAWSIIDDVWVGAHYYDQRGRRADAMCERWWRGDVIGRRSWDRGSFGDMMKWRSWNGRNERYGRRAQRRRGS